MFLPRTRSEAIVYKRALLEREALLLLVTHAVVVHCLQRVEVQSYGLAGKEAGRMDTRAQNRNFCALLPAAPPIFGLPEHKIEVFVRFYPPEPPFSGISSTKSRFLCAFTLRNTRFRAFRAQNRGFCALLGFGTPILRRFEHKIKVFVREQRDKWHREA